MQLCFHRSSHCGSGGTDMGQFPLVGPSHSTRSKRLDAQRSINWFPELSQSPTSKYIAAMIGAPGLRQRLTLAGSPVRGMFKVNSSTYVAVVGSNVYRVSAANVSTLIGTIAYALTRVSIESNGFSLMIVTGGIGSPAYSVDLTTWVVAPIAGFPGADRVGYVDNRFVFNESGTNRVRYTDLNSVAYVPLNVFSVEGYSDKLMSLLVDHREVWLPGETSTEVYITTGDADNPFERVNGAFMEIGCAAFDTVAHMAESVVWLSADKSGQGTVVKATGYIPKPISTHAVEYAIAQYPRIDDAYAFVYQQEGHEFYFLTFPSGNATWVYDNSSEEWHERVWRNPVDNSQNRHRALCHLAFDNAILIGDRVDGRIYEFDLDYYYDDTDPLVAERIAPHLSDNDFKFQVYDRLTVDMSVGTGKPVPDGIAPQVILQWSTDGGFTWSNEHRTTLGLVGERKVRAVWRRLGRSLDRVFKVTVSDPVPRNILGASVQVRKGR